MAEIEKDDSCLVIANKKVEDSEIKAEKAEEIVDGVRVVNAKVHVEAAEIHVEAAVVHVEAAKEHMDAAKETGQDLHKI